MTAFLQALLVLLLQSTGLLLLGLGMLQLTRRHGPAVQTLIGRAALSSVALLLLLAPLAGHVQAVWRIPLNVQHLEPTPQQVATLPEREGEEFRKDGTGLASGPNALGAAQTKNASLQEGIAQTEGQDTKGAAETKGATETKGAASSAPTSVVPTLHPPALGGPLHGNWLQSKEVGSFWLLISAALLLWLGLCQWHLTRLRRTAHPITSGPATDLLASLTLNPPGLLTHPSVHSPFLAGLRRPAIFLPVAYETEFDTLALRAILAHELAHRTRCDNLWTLAARLLTALLWPQPLLWLLCRHLEQISEDACDEAVLAQDCPPRAYADCLLSLATRPPLELHRRTLTAGVAPFRSSLGRRVQHILTKGTRPMKPITQRLRLTIAALTFAAAVGGACLVSSAPAQPKQPSIVGIWQCSHNDGTSNVLIFSADGSVEEIGPWPGSSRAIGHSYTSNTVIGHSYGQYTVAGQHLKYILTRVWVEGEKPWTTDPERHDMIYTLSENKLTLHWGSRQKSVSISRRVPSFTKAMIGLKPVLVSDTVIFASGNVRVSGMIGNGSPEVHPSFSLKGGQPTALSDGQAKVKADYLVKHYKGNMRVYETLNNGTAVLLAATKPNQQLNQAQFLAGLTPVEGPGVVVTLRDSKKPIPAPMPAGMMRPNIIHDSDINQVVNELRAAGAEAISINRQRLVATSSVRTAGTTMLVNNSVQTAPYTIKAIGNSTTMIAALQGVGSLASQIKSFDPAMFSIQVAASLTLPAYSGGGSERLYAKPVAESGNSGQLERSKALQMQYAALEAKRNKYGQAFTQYERTFDTKLRQALPQSDAQTFAKARNLEFGIGWNAADLAQGIPGDSQYPRKIQEEIRKAQQQSLRAELARMRAEEAKLFSKDAETQQRLAEVHALALHHPQRPLQLQLVEVDVQMDDLKKRLLQQRQMLEQKNGPQF